MGGGVSVVYRCGWVGGGGGGVIRPSWLFTRHCHYRIKQLPAAAPLQADSETAVLHSASEIQETIISTSCYDFKNKGGVRTDEP